MRTGKFGIRFAFYAVVAFILAFFGQTLALFLLAGFVIAVEKDEWASKQCIQAVGLLGIQWLISEVLSLLQRPDSWISKLITDYDSPYYTFSKIYGNLFYYTREIVDLVILVLVIIAILNVVKGKDAKVPVIDKFANWAYGIANPTVNTNTTATATSTANTTATVNSASKKCPKCGADVEGKFCDKCGTKLD